MRRLHSRHKTGTIRGCSSVVELLLPKQVVVSSILITRSIIAVTKRLSNFIHDSPCFANLHQFAESVVRVLSWTLGFGGQLEQTPAL